MSQSHNIDGFVAEGFEDVREAFEENWIALGELGATFCAYLHGNCVVDLWGGWIDRGRQTVWEKQSIVNMFSTTKGLMSAAIAVLADSGELDYDAKVTKYWPEFSSFGKDRLSVAQLLSHQAGLCGPRIKISVEDLYDWDRMCTLLAEQEPFWEPGTDCGYHALTWGYLAGELIRRITGQSPGSYFHDVLAEPLKADCWIGLPESEEPRVSNMVAPPQAMPMDRQLSEEDVRNFIEMQSTEYYRAALANPIIRPYTDASSRPWRAAEIPAANGTGNARGVARIYAALANGGELEGTRVISEQGIREATKLEWDKGLNLVLRRRMPFARGFLLSRDGVYGPNPETFGHSGAGGSMGFADPVTGLSCSYVMNQMHNNITSDPRWHRLVTLMYEKLSN